MSEWKTKKALTVSRARTGTRHPQDGLIDFSGYSLQQLRELQYTIDSAAFPKNHARLLAALESKDASVSVPPPTGASDLGRFTPHAGVRGWLQALRARSPVYGRGSLEVGSSEIILTGMRRNWLGVGVETRLARPIDCVRNVVCEEGGVRFEIARKYRTVERICFLPESSEYARTIVNGLPAATSAKFLQHWVAIREFNRKLQGVGGRAWVTPVLVALNLVVFAVMAAVTRRAGEFVPQELLAWGANFGPLTVSGQWWRLFTALFLHLNLAHVLLNMWALWNIGRISERLFGRWTLLFLYVVSGSFASLASIAWDPSHYSVGASGAIFGIFGAFLAFLWRQRHQIPSVLLRRHWISTTAFVMFNLVDGALRTGIDNAAHVSGLISGFMLGVVLARPLDPVAREQVPVSRCLGAGALVVVMLSAALWQVVGIGSGLTVPEAFFRNHPDYVSGELKNLELWNSLAARAGAGSLSDSEFGDKFERDILPFWKQQKDLLAPESKTFSGPQRAFAELVAEFSELRYEWASALVEGSRGVRPNRYDNALRLAAKTNVLTAKLERLRIRFIMDHRRRALAAAPLVMRVRLVFSSNHWGCIESRYRGVMPSDADDKTDGPAVRHALGCLAQELFMSGSYRTLDSMLQERMSALGDLHDGSSSYEGLLDGLENLFADGGLNPEVLLEHTADWRRAVEGSVPADVAEAMLLHQWAWQARGSGFAKSISSQNMALYSFRTEMAKAALDDVAVRAANNPQWYVLSLSVGLDQGLDADKRRDIFDRGYALTRVYRPLYRQMLRGLMPRWGGSFDDVDKFITQVDATTGSPGNYEWYATLYSIYVQLEGDEIDFFSDTKAFWSGMRTGYANLVARYPDSDYLRNRFACFACRAGDKGGYGRLRALIGRRVSSVAWTGKYSIQSCDKSLTPLGATPGRQADATVAQSRLAAPGRQIESLGGIRLGMTRGELLMEKGKALHEESSYWVYNSIDSAHNGVLSVVFSPPRQGSEGVVTDIEYVGDEVSAPPELPYLNGDSSVSIIQQYGPQLEGSLVLSGPMTFKFRNGLYVKTRDAKVSRYGVYMVR